MDFKLIRNKSEIGTLLNFLDFLEITKFLKDNKIITRKGKFPEYSKRRSARSGYLNYLFLAVKKMLNHYFPYTLSKVRGERRFEFNFDYSYKKNYPLHQKVLIKLIKKYVKNENSDFDSLFYIPFDISSEGNRNIFHIRRGKGFFSIRNNFLSFFKNKILIDLENTDEELDEIIQLLGHKLTFSINKMIEDYVPIALTSEVQSDTEDQQENKQSNFDISTYNGIRIDDNAIIIDECPNRLNEEQLNDEINCEDSIPERINNQDLDSEITIESLMDEYRDVIEALRNYHSDNIIVDMIKRFYLPNIETR